MAIKPGNRFPAARGRRPAVKGPMGRTDRPVFSLGSQIGRKTAATRRL